MKVLLLKDWGQWKAGTEIMVRDWNQATRLIAAGIAKRMTWKESLSIR